VNVDNQQRKIEYNRLFINRRMDCLNVKINYLFSTARKKMLEIAVNDFRKDVDLVMCENCNLLEDSHITFRRWKQSLLLDIE
jgi:hypothetical protein